MYVLDLPRVSHILLTGADRTDGRPGATFPEPTEAPRDPGLEPILPTCPAGVATRGWTIPWSGTRDRTPTFLPPAIGSTVLFTFLPSAVPVAAERVVCTTVMVRGAILFSVSSFLFGSFILWDFCLLGHGNVVMASWPGLIGELFCLLWVWRPFDIAQRCFLFVPDVWSGAFGGIGFVGEEAPERVATRRGPVKEVFISGFFYMSQERFTQ